jgi:hypothetical protein
VPTDATVTRLQAHLRSVAARYPHAWDQIALFRANRKALGDWPRWCYCPLAGAMAVVTRGRDHDKYPVSLDEVSDLAVVGALSAWRATQGIYRIDADLLDALCDTPIEGDLPADLLTHLPEWCVYVETPGRTVEDGTAMAGFFAGLESAPDSGDARHAELRILRDVLAPDGRQLLLPLILHLGHGTLSACLSAALDESERQARRRGAWDYETRRAIDAARTQAQTLLGPLVSLLLYLCSEAAEVRDAAGSLRLPRYQRPVETKRGPKWVPPDGPTTWEVGWRMGAALREARAAVGSAGHGGEHAAPRAHLRRAHWHTYITGPRADAHRQRRDLRWLHPILVGAGDIVPTIHRVRGEGDRQ